MDITDKSTEELKKKALTIMPIVPLYTKADFLETTKPYEFVYSFEDDQFTQGRIMNKVVENAKSVKVGNFKGLFADYKKALKRMSGAIADGNLTRFEGQEIELNCGMWTANDEGISSYIQNAEIFACPHALLPVLRLVNVDTKVEKLKIAYRKGKYWRSIIVDKKTLASNNSIIALSDVGISVTSENSKALVKYISDLENINYDIIPEKSSVSRLGWIDGEGFSPYFDGLTFDGEDCFSNFFNSVCTKGGFDKWIALAKETRQGDVPVRMLLAASFASVLIKKVEALSFFVHIWGSESGIGKTVGLMFAASVWANPEMGKYVHTFNGTAVSQELSAGFVNSLPLILDEFQVLKNKKDFEQSVYMLAEGVGRGRGSKQGGVQRTQSWKNCILTSGEMPITNFVTGAGAFSRIVEVECSKKLFDNPQNALAIMRNNYGYAGKEFIRLLQEDGNAAYAQSLYDIFFNEIIKSQTAEKQATAGALILAADRLVTEWIFQDNRALKFDDIAEFLQTKTEIDINERAYNYICEMVAANSNKFNEHNENGEIWGTIDEGANKAYIIRNIFERICEDGGYSSRAILSWLMKKSLIEVSFDSKTKKPIPTKQRKINNSNVRCVVVQLKNWEGETIFDYIDEPE